MEYDTFVFRKLLKKLSGQVIYQINEDSSTIDFKFIKEGDNNKFVTYFRFHKYIENPNSVEVNLREYIDKNNIFWVSRQSILYFMIDQMQNLCGHSYFYNIDVVLDAVEVTISLRDDELGHYNLFGGVISEKIDQLKEINGDLFLKEYNNYSKFNELFDFDEDYQFANVKTKYVLYNECSDKIFDVGVDSFVYSFKLIADLKPMVKISFNCEKNHLNPIEKYLKNYIKQKYKRRDIFGNELSIDDYINKSYVRRDLLGYINRKLSSLLNSNDYNFYLADSMLSYSNISVVSSLKNVDFNSIHDVLVGCIREEILKFDFPVNYFDTLSSKWSGYKEAFADKSQLNNILGGMDVDEKDFKLKYIETELKNKVILKIDDVSFKILQINKTRFKFSVNRKFHSSEFRFEPKKNSIPNFHEINYDSPFYFNNARYSGELIGDNMIFEIHSTYIFNSNTILERNIRSILLNILQNDEFLNKTNKLWQEKLDNDKKIEEEKISKRKQIKSDYDDIIKELDGHSNIKGDSVRW